MRKSAFITKTKPPESTDISTTKFKYALYYLNKCALEKDSARRKIQFPVQNYRSSFKIL